jgi:hypothetical protein
VPAHCPALSFTEKMKSDSESKKTFDGAPHLINRRYLQCSYGEGSSPVFLPALPAKTTPLEFIESKALAQSGTAAFSAFAETSSRRPCFGPALDSRGLNQEQRF